MPLGEERNAMPFWYVNVPRCSAPAEPIVVHGFGLVAAACSGAMEVNVSINPLHKVIAEWRQ
jgi:hypothetical protein